MAAPLTRKNTVILSLDPDKVLLIEAMLMRGDSAPKVADRIQNEWGLLKDKQPSALIKALNRFRASAVAGKMIDKFEVKDSKGRTQIQKIDLEALRTKLNSYQSTQDLAITQQGRLNKILAQEHEKPNLLWAASREIRLLLEILQHLSALEFDLGITARVAKKHIVTDLTELSAVAKGELAVDMEDMESYRTLVNGFIEQVKTIEGSFKQLPEEEGVPVEEEEEDTP